MLPYEGVPLRRRGKARFYSVDLALTIDNISVIRVTQPRCRFDERNEHRLQIESRAADDLEHIASRSLVFERFFEIAGALAQFSEQPRILHRDDRLRREIL